MRIHELINESTETNEGWKTAAAGAALAGAAALSPFLHKDEQPIQHVAQQQQGKIEKKLGIQPISNQPKTEGLLLKTAAHHGIKGVELAQFLAQCNHESAGFSKMKEQGSLNYFAKKYGPKTNPRIAKILGNKHIDDGSKYYGRGYIQITGRENYRKAGEALGLPLEDNPELAARPDVAAKIAVWYWNTRVKPNVYDFNNTSAVTKKINPGLHGLESREQKFKDYLSTMK